MTPFHLAYLVLPLGGVAAFFVVWPSGHCACAWLMAWCVSKSNGTWTGEHELLLWKVSGFEFLGLFFMPRPYYRIHDLQISYHSTMDVSYLCPVLSYMWLLGVILEVYGALVENVVLCLPCYFPVLSPSKWLSNAMHGSTCAAGAYLWPRLDMVPANLQNLF